MSSGPSEETNFSCSRDRNQSWFQSGKEATVKGKRFGYGVLGLRISGFLFLVMGFVALVPLSAQYGGIDRSPPDRIETNKTATTPRNLEAFTGKLSLVELKRKKLTLLSVEGRFTEIFTCKNGPTIRTANGKKRKFRDLQPGMTLVVYYNSKKGRRTVRDVMILKGISMTKEEGSPKSGSKSGLKVKSKSESKS